MALLRGLLHFLWYSHNFCYQLELHIYSFWLLGSAHLDKHSDPHGIWNHRINHTQSLPQKNFQLQESANFCGFWSSLDDDSSDHLDVYCQIESYD